MCTGTEVLCMFQYLPPAPGDFIDVETGNVVGKHKGKNFILEHHAHVIFKTWALSCIDCVPFLDILSRLIRMSWSPHAVS